MERSPWTLATEMMTPPPRSRHGWDGVFGHEEAAAEVDVDDALPRFFREVDGVDV